MTRKRFIKLLMSWGESKRRAQTIAYLYHLRGEPYKSAYADYVLKKSLRVCCERLGNAFRKHGLAINGLTAAVKLLALNYAESFGAFV